MADVLEGLKLLSILPFSLNLFPGPFCKMFLDTDENFEYKCDAGWNTFGWIAKNFQMETAFYINGAFYQHSNFKLTSFAPIFLRGKVWGATFTQGHFLTFNFFLTDVTQGYFLTSFFHV